MPTQSSIESKQGLPETDDLLGLDVYSADGALVGRLAGYVSQVPEDESGIAWGIVDLIERDGDPIGPRRVFISGSGFPIQAEITVPIDLLDVDTRGRRATLRLTMEQIRCLPRRDPQTDEPIA
jgi:hypothetical protein